MSLMPDQTFYPSPRMAMQAPPEPLGYVALLNIGAELLRIWPARRAGGFPCDDNELHHFGWNAFAHRLPKMLNDSQKDGQPRSC